jgi:carboxypeptidase C (cathepsin A)
MAKGDGEGTGGVVVVSGASELRKLLGPGGAPGAPAEGEDAGDRTSTTHHEVTIDGAVVAYQAVAGTLRVGLEDPDKPKGRMFYVAYTRTDVPDPASRPIAFCFNGGPGSSAIWLHLGCLGPRRVLADVGTIPPPGASAVDNPLSLLDAVDLVFVDPIATGYSRADDRKGADYLGVQGDTEAMAEFVRRYTTRHDRWASPKLLIGESYGTTRAATVAKHLQDRHGLYLNGLVLISLALKFQALLFADGNDLPYTLYVPAYAAAAIHHGVLRPDDPAAFVAAAARWATDVYLPALHRGATLPAEDQARIARELAGFIGLSPEFVTRCDNRVDLLRFCRELLRDRRLGIGRLDARFVSHVADAAGDRMESDPSYHALFGVYTSALHRELRSRLKYDEDEVYEVLNLKAHQAWVWDRHNEVLDVTHDLRDAMISNPHLRLFVASGTYDLATPPAATAYTLSHLGIGLDPDQRAGIVHHEYPAGHMMYAHEPSLAKMREHLIAFLGGLTR